MTEQHKRGRPKGSPNKKTAERIAAIEASGETPLEYMLRVMRDPKVDKERRDRNAAQAAPYVHPKLAQIDANARLNLDGSVTFTWEPPKE